MTDDDRSAVPEPGPGSGPEPTRQFPAHEGPPAAYSQWQSPETGYAAPAQQYPQAGYQQSGPNQFAAPQQHAGAAAAMATDTVRGCGPCRGRSGSCVFPARSRSSPACSRC